MTTAAQALAGVRASPVADFTAARLKKMNAAVLAAEQALQAAVARRDAFCRQWSSENGYCVPLKPEQVSRALEAGRG